MSIKNLATEKRQPSPSAHTRLALSVIGRAVEDVKKYDAALHRSAARFLNGSAEFYFWANVLEQDSTWLLRELRTRLRQDSPRAFERLSQYAHPQDLTVTGGWGHGDTVVPGARPSTRRHVSSPKRIARKPATDRGTTPEFDHCAYRKPHTHGSRGRPALAQGRRAQPA